MQGRVIVSSFACDVLADIAFFVLANLPFISLNVIEVDLGARVAHIASDCVRVKQTFVDSDILEGYVSHGHSRLSRASALLIKRIKQASRSVSVRLFHLLRANVYCPPNRAIHRKVLIENVFNQASSWVARVWLHINALERPNHSHIPKGDISHAIAVILRRNTPDCHSYSKNNGAILN